MADGTRFSQLADSVAHLREESRTLREVQDKQQTVMDAVLQQLNNLAVSYDQLAAQRGPSPNNNPVDTASIAAAHHSRHSNFDGAGSIQARTIKLEFPRFNGIEPLEWILKAEQFFDYFQTPENQRIDIAFFHMEGKALSWFVWLKEAGPILGWDHFTECLKVRFGPSIYEDPVGAFTKLQQHNTVEEYQTAFENLSNKVKGITEEFRISTFISGLKDEVKLMVTMFKPTTLSAAFGLAKLQEEEVNRKNKGSPVRNLTSNSIVPINKYPTLNAPSPIPLKTINSTFGTDNRSVPNNENTVRRTTIPIKRLTPIQMQERREKGLCYNCDEKYQFGHKCSIPKIFLLEGLEENCAEEIPSTASMLSILHHANSQQEEEELGEVLRGARRKYPNLAAEVFDGGGNVTGL